MDATTQDYLDHLVELAGSQDAVMAELDSALNKLKAARAAVVQLTGVDPATLQTALERRQ